MDFTESDSAPRGDLPKPPGFSESSSLDTVRRAPCNRTRPGLSRRVPRTGPRGCQEGTGGPDTAQAEEGEGALLVTWKELHDDGLHARTPLGPPPMRPQLGVRRVLIPCAVDEREWCAHILDNDHLLRHLQPHQVGLHRQHRCTYCTYPPTDTDMPPPAASSPWAACPAPHDPTSLSLVLCQRSCASRIPRCPWPTRPACSATR